MSIKKKKAGEEYVPPFLERLQNCFARPDNTTIMRRAILYGIMAGSHTRGLRFGVSDYMPVRNAS